MSLASPPEDRPDLSRPLIPCPQGASHRHHGWQETISGVERRLRCPGVPGDRLLGGWNAPTAKDLEEDQAGSTGLRGTDVYHIVEDLLPEIRRRMVASAGEYGPNGHRELGQRGQYADMYRKWTKLKRALWDGEDTSDWRESPREILMDLIGHALLTIAIIDRPEADNGR